MPYGQTLIEDATGSGWQQPAFDPRINRLPMLQADKASGTQGVQQGYMKQAKQTVTSGGRPIDNFSRMVRFLYNPSSVSVSHVISNMNAALDPNLRSNLDDGLSIGSTGATVSFSLLFDRTYEVSNPDKFNTPAAEKGVQVDIDAIYAMVGILQLQPLLANNQPSVVIPDANATAKTSKAEAIVNQFVTDTNTQLSNAGADSLRINVQGLLSGQQNGGSIIQSGQGLDFFRSQLEKKLKDAGLSLNDIPAGYTGTPGATSSATTSAPTYGDVFGFMQVTPLIIVFGQQRATWTPVLQYYGYINSLDIEYAHWTQRMVPSRCSVSIGFNLFAQSVSQTTQVAVTP